MASPSGDLEQAEASRGPLSALPNLNHDQEYDEKSSPDRGLAPAEDDASPYENSIAETTRDPEFEPPKDFEFSKHDRGWRRLVRNFTPS